MKNVLIFCFCNHSAIIGDAFRLQKRKRNEDPNFARRKILRNWGASFVFVFAYEIAKTRNENYAAHLSHKQCEKT